MPDQLRMLGKAFDEVWDAIEAHYVSDPQSVEVARLTLANCLLAKYRNGLTNPELLKAAALPAMQPWGLTLSSGRAAVHPRPWTEIARVNELAAEVHLYKLGVIALSEAISNVLFSIAPVFAIARTHWGEARDQPESGMNGC
jgi:hypothetical protein